jgi:hypothetical protein
MSKTKKEWSQVTSLSGIVLMITWVGLGAGCSGRLQPTKQDSLEAAAVLFNASCPRMIDADTRIDSGFYIPDSTFQFDYTLINYETAHIDAEALANYLRPRIRSNISFNPEMKVQRDHQVTMVFHYRDSNGNFITRVEITPDMY